MATTDLKFWDGSEWVSIGTVAGETIKLPVAAADGKSQVDGADGLIFIENTEDSGEVGMAFVTKADGTRWKANVEEGFGFGGSLTFYNATGEACFTLNQNGDVYLEQEVIGSAKSATTRAFVEALANTFPVIDDGRDADGTLVSSWAKIDTDSGSNYKAI